MAGFWGSFKASKISSPPRAIFFVANESNCFRFGIQRDSFQVEHFGVSDRIIKCATDRNDHCVVAYAGYVQNFGELANIHLKESNVKTDASCLAELYKKLGNKLWHKLNGNFAAVIFDRIKHEFLLISDRFCSIPIYSIIRSDAIYFSTSMLGLASIFDERPYLDLQAVVEFLMFGYPLNDRTLIKNIQMIADSTIIKFNKGECHIQSYSKPDFTPSLKINNVEEASEGMFFAIEEAIKRYCKSNSVGLAMSGGLDSRYIAAQIRDKVKLAVVNGNPDSYEIKGAKRVCELLDIPLAVSFYSPDEFGKTVQDAIIANDGIINTPEFLFVTQLLSQNQCEVGVFGAYGNGIRGQIGPDLVWKYNDIQSARNGLCESANREYIPFNKASQAFGDLINQKLIEQARKTFLASFNRITSQEPFNVCLYQDIYYRNRRRILPAFGVGRRFLEVRYPFTDNELIDFVFSLPLQLRTEVDLYRGAFMNRFPELSMIPNQLGHNYIYETKYGWLRQIKRKVYYGSPNFVRYLVKPALPEHPNPANRDIYHTVLKEKTEACLKSLVKAGIMNPEFVDNILIDQFRGYINRYPLFHKLVTLSYLITGFGFWKGLRISQS